MLRQQSLMRAVIRKIEFQHLLSNPLTMYRVLHALISMLTVDSDFTASEIAHLAKEVRNLTGATDYVTAPVHVRAGQVHLDRAHQPPAVGRDQAGLDLGVRQALPVHGDARRAAVRGEGVRIILASLAALVVVVGMVVGGYVYINRVAVGIGRVPVMFATGHAASRPVPVAARSQSARQR